MPVCCPHRKQTGDTLEPVWAGTKTERDVMGVRSFVIV